MLLGCLTVGSVVLLDLHKDGSKNVVGEIIDRSSYTEVCIRTKSELALNGDTLIIMEITDKSLGHVYRYTRVTISGRDGYYVASSNEDIDYHNVRQEKRFKFNMRCRVRKGQQDCGEGALNDVSLSGLAIVVPKCDGISVGDVLNLSTYYTDGTWHRLVASVVRIDAERSDGVLLGCRLIEGKDFAHAVIERLQKV